MKDLQELINKCNLKGIVFNYNNDKLSIEVKEDKVIDDILLEVKQNKERLISFFKQCRPLSFAQERLWFIDQYEHNASYNMPWAVKLVGKLDINILEKTLSEIFRRHEVLRTNFVTINNVASQLIHEEPKSELKTLDQSHLPEEEANQTIHELIDIETHKPFDLANDSLIRLVLYKINDEEHTLFLNKHHIISDGWSFSVFFKEVSILYKAFSENRPSPLPELEIQYADYAVWQREHIEGKILEKQEAYWKDKLSGTSILEFPTDRTRPAEQTFNGTSQPFILDKDILEKLNTFSKENDVTLFMTLLSVFKVLLYKYTGQEDICVGSPIANRTRREIEPLIGFFVNTLALRSELSGEISFVDLVKQVKQTTLDAYSNQDIPFEKVVDILQTERNSSYSPLFQVMMALQNTPARELSFGGLILKQIDFDFNISKFDLTLFFAETAEGLVGEIQYNTDLFDQDRIERMIRHFKVLVKSIIANPTIKISELEILTPSEKHKLLVEWNDTVADYPKDICIHQLFEEQAEKTPDNVAVVFEKEELTYLRLNEKSNQLAHYLKSKGVKPDSLVGICMERSLEMIVGLLGILKAGGAYVPIDPTYPEERISFMLEDADCEIVLTQEHLKLPEINSEMIYLDADWDKIDKKSTENVRTEVKSDNLVYVIYTSGSTGKPKGTEIKNISLLNLTQWHYKKFKIEYNTRATQLANIAFDAAAWEVWPYLLHGASLYLVPQKTVSDNSELFKFINTHQISHCFIPTPIAELLLQNDWTKNTELSYLFIGGDRFIGKSAAFENYNFKVVNNYGPTENTVVTTSIIMNKDKEFPPIGKPINNTKVYILDKDHKLLPVGVPGELCISGDGLARGYLKRSELTAQKFIKNPFCTDLDSRLYKTGDLVRYLPDGNIEFIGRIDNQVKIRGFRIELDEIENCLLTHDKIEAAILHTLENPMSETKEIVAYIKINNKSLNRKAMNQNRVDNWLSIYDESYSNINNRFERDFTGWNSSYTGLPIPEQEMSEWLESTTDLIKQFKPQNIFEIGCGTGLVLFNLINHFKEYCGIDFSKESVDYLKDVIEKDKTKYNNVEVYQSSADNIKDIHLEEVDTVIINSVVQYFPGLQYLEQVIVDSIEKIKNSGIILLGDIRNYQLLEDFFRSTELYNLEGEKTIENLNQRIKNGIRKEKELLVDPQYFVSLQKRFQRISHVDIRYKQGIYQTEMNKYRYNVILHIDKETTKKIDKRLDWDKDANIYEELQKVLKKESPGVLSIDNVPNFYLEEDKNLANKMENDQVDIKELKLLVKNEKINGFNGILSICPGEYRKEIVWNRKKYFCNILLVKNTINGSFVINQSEMFGYNEYAEYSNDTLKNDYVLESKNEIKKFLEKKLPDYMIPSYFVEIEEIPLTPNGKIDRKMLPDPRVERILTNVAYVPPRNETEQKLADIWSKVLGVEKVGIYDNFFELGGDSIISIQIVSRAKQDKLDLTPKDIFKHQTIAELAKVSNVNGSKIIAEQGLVTGEIALTPIQSWFFEEDFENKDHWNQAFMLKVKDTVEISVIENAINALVQQHDVLRLAYHIEKGIWTQKYTKLLKFELEVVDCSNLSGEELSKSIEKHSSKTQGSLSITGGELFKAVLFKTGNYNELLIAINHLVVDGVSWRIIIEDLQKACWQQINNKEIELGLKTSSFKQWSEKLTEYAKSDKLAKELKFWNETISKSNEPLPIDFSGENTGISAKNISVKLNKKLTKQLLKEAGKAYKTEINDLLLTALAISLEKWTGNNNIIINLEGHGREDIFIDTDISRTVGWFTTQFPVCLSLEKDNNIADTIKSIKEQLRAIPNKGVRYGILKYLHPENSVKEGVSLQKNNEISFNYLGQFDNVNENRDLISLSKLSPGVSVSKANHRINIIDINSMISGGELVINFTYSDNLHKKETIDNLVKSYVAGLQNIIEHCIQPESKGYTPSDFQLSEITQEELDDLLFNNTSTKISNSKKIKI